MGLGGEVRAVRFQEVGAGGDLLNAGVQFARIFECDDSRQGDGMTHREELLRLRPCARKAVKDGLESSGVGFQGGQSVRPTIPLMDDDVEFQFEREIELLLEKNGLAILEIGIGQGQLFVSWGDTAHSGGGSGERVGRVAGKAVVVEPTLTDGDNFGMTSQFSDLLDGRCGSLGNLARVQANGGIDLGKGIGQGQSRAAGFEGGANGDDSGDAGFGGPLNDVRPVGIKVREIEVAMSIDQHSIPTL